jgi:hypothetical protein
MSINLTEEEIQEIKHLMDIAENEGFYDYPEFNSLSENLVIKVGI